MTTTHSLINRIVNMESSCNGFDKTIRLITYCVKLFVHYYEKNYNGKDTNLWVSLDATQKIISDIRSTIRIPSVFTTIRDLMQLDEQDNFLYFLKLIQCGIMLMWLPADHFSFFVRRKILPTFDEATGKRFQRISCQFWATSVICDYIRDFYKLYHHSDKLDALNKKNIDLINTISDIDHVLEIEKKYVESAKNPDSAKRKLERKQIELLKNRATLEDAQKKMIRELDRVREEKNDIYLNLWTNACNLPMALDLSTEDGFLPDYGNPLIGTIGSVFAFWSKWRHLK